MLSANFKPNKKACDSMAFLYQKGINRIMMGKLTMSENQTFVTNAFFFKFRHTKLHPCAQYYQMQL